MNQHESYAGYQKYLEIICKEAELLGTQWVCETIVKHYKGTNYKNKELHNVRFHASWQGWWPVIDEDGDLTGHITEGGDGYLVTSDYCAMISEADAARAGAAVCDGVATLPEEVASDEQR